MDWHWRVHSSTYKCLFHVQYFLCSVVCCSVNLSFHRFSVSEFCHFVISSFCHSVISLSHHFIILSFCNFIVLLFRCFVVSLLCCLVILLLFPFCCFVISSFCCFVVLSLCRFVFSSFCHFVISSFRPRITSKIYFLTSLQEIYLEWSLHIHCMKWPNDWKIAYEPVIIRVTLVSYFHRW